MTMIEDSELTRCVSYSFRKLLQVTCTDEGAPTDQPTTTTGPHDPDVPVVQPLSRVRPYPARFRRSKLRSAPAPRRIIPVPT
jgi:hypothetical protein